ncbi:MAG: hypothetical protein K2G88_07180, partial [Oscillospiraceae bacterium]|nr:hypothetical protein [Oscillospiraceae bacterium]
SVQSKRDEKSN